MCLCSPPFLLFSCLSIFTTLCFLLLFGCPSLFTTRSFSCLAVGLCSPPFVFFSCMSVHIHHPFFLSPVCLSVSVHHPLFSSPLSVSLWFLFLSVCPSLFTTLRSLPLSVRLPLVSLPVWLAVSVHRSSAYSSPVCPSPFGFSSCLAGCLCSLVLGLFFSCLSVSLWFLFLSGCLSLFTGLRLILLLSVRLPLVSLPVWLAVSVHWSSSYCSPVCPSPIGFSSFLAGCLCSPVFGLFFSCLSVSLWLLFLSGWLSLFTGLRLILLLSVRLPLVSLPVWLAVSVHWSSSYSSPVCPCSPPFVFFSCLAGCLCSPAFFFSCLSVSVHYSFSSPVCLCSPPFASSPDCLSLFFTLLLLLSVSVNHSSSPVCLCPPPFFSCLSVSVHRPSSPVCLSLLANLLLLSVCLC